MLKNGIYISIGWLFFFPYYVIFMDIFCLNSVIKDMINMIMTEKSWLKFCQSS